MHVFVSLPFEETFETVFEAVSKGAMLRGLEVVRTDATPDNTSPSATAPVAIRDSRFIIADLTGDHPGVLRDVRHASEFGKPCFLIVQEGSEPVVSHVQGARIHPYDPEDLDRLQSAVLNFAVALSSAEDSRSADTTRYDSISARIGLMHIVPGRWKNPFSD